MVAAHLLHRLQTKELNLEPCLERLDEGVARDLPDGEAEVSPLMYLLDKPLLDSRALVLGPELLELLCRPLWDQSLVLYTDPEAILVEVLGLIDALYLEQLDALYDRELLLLAQVEVLTILAADVNQMVVLLLLQHLGTADLRGVL